MNQGCARLLQILSDIQDQGLNKGKQGEKKNKNKLRKKTSLVLSLVIAVSEACSVYLAAWALLW